MTDLILIISNHKWFDPRKRKNKNTNNNFVALCRPFNWLTITKRKIRHSSSLFKYRWMVKTGRKWISWIQMNAKTMAKTNNSQKKSTQQSQSALKWRGNSVCVWMRARERAHARATRKKHLTCLFQKIPTSWLLWLMSFYLVYRSNSLSPFSREKKNKSNRT